MRTVHEPSVHEPSVHDEPSVHRSTEVQLRQIMRTGDMGGMDSSFKVASAKVEVHCKNTQLVRNVFIFKPLDIVSHHAVFPIPARVLSPTSAVSG